MTVAHRNKILTKTMQPFLDFAMDPKIIRMQNDPNALNFAFGNPQELPLQAFSNALASSSQPQNKDWFAYKLSEESSQKIVAQSLRQRYEMAFEPDDIAMTNGGFAAIALALQTVVNAGDEVIFISPPWFFYEMLICSVGAVPVRVRINPGNFDLDLEAIRAAINPKTAAIIVNSPNNPTGKIYPPETLQALGDLLRESSNRIGREIYLLSDEAYSRILYDGRDFPTPTAYYENSFLLYTYGKTLLTPGQRIGYVALPPTMPDRETMRGALLVSQLALAFAFPNALLQHALPELEKLSIDMEHLQHKRDWMHRELEAMGYELHSPEGTFYLLPRSPIEDDLKFADLLAEQNIICLPGKVVEMPGYFRLSLTANEQMIEQSLAGFAAARKAALA
jgi:aspartate aminotransferase